MNTERIFVGNIYEVKTYTSVEILKDLRTDNYIRRSVSKIIKEIELYEDNVILIQFRKHGRSRYVKIKDYTYFLELANKFDIDDSRFMDTFPYYEKQLFIRESELRPYSTKEKNLSLQRIKKIDNT